MANSAAIAARPETWADMVRPGAVLYGYHPGFDPPELRTKFEASFAAAAGDEPACANYQCALHRRRAKAWATTPVGWRSGLRGIAVLAAGYGDGIHRSLGNKGSVAIRGTARANLGIISMDVTMLDVTDIPDAELSATSRRCTGSDGGKRYPANVVARSIGTVTSDLISGVSRRVPRFYLP